MPSLPWSASGFPEEPGSRQGKGSENPSFPGSPGFPTQKQGCCGAGRGCKDRAEEGEGQGNAYALRSKG